VRISGRGIEKNVPLRGMKSVPWGRFAGAGFSQGMVVVAATRDSGRTRTAFTVTMTQPNSVLLPDLLRELAARS
jgi:hypothetical protein